MVSTADDGFLFPAGPGVSQDQTEMNVQRDPRRAAGSVEPGVPGRPDRRLDTHHVHGRRVVPRSAVTNVLWTVGGVEKPAGTYPVAAPTTIELEATAVEPYSIDPDPTLCTLPFTAAKDCPILPVTGL